MKILINHENLRMPFSKSLRSSSKPIRKINQLQGAILGYKRRISRIVNSLTGLRKTTLTAKRAKTGTTKTSQLNNLTFRCLKVFRRTPTSY
jgi:hypothetical protein